MSVAGLDLQFDGLIVQVLEIIIHCIVFNL